MRVPLNSAEPEGAKIRVAFTFVPRADRSRPATGTVIANPGGPSPVLGQEKSLRHLFGSVLDRKNLLLVDPRGLGKSSPLRCDGFDARKPANVRACTDRLGPRLRHFNVRQAAADVDAVRRALGLGALTWWGHSYGTVFATAYANRYPDSTAAVYLNATQGFRRDGYTDPILTEGLHDEAIRVLDETCRASQACRALPGSARDQLSRLTQLLRDRPDPKVSWPQLSHLVVGSGDAVTGRELSAAVAAYLNGDRAPLRRLAAEYAGAEDNAEQVATNPTYPGKLTYYCNDAAYPFDRHAAPATKRRQYDAYNRRHLDAPFRPSEVLTGINWDEVCPSWPTPGETPPAPPNAHYPDVPTLVVNGAHDATTPSDGAAATARRFPHATFVSIPSGLHGHGLGTLGPYSKCVVEAMRTFVNRPRYPAQHPRCDGASYRALGSFPQSGKDTATTVHAPGLNAIERAAVGTAFATAADAVARRNSTNRTTALAPEQPGLRGGKLSFDDAHRKITVNRVSYTTDATASGQISYGGEDGTATARLRIHQSSAPERTVELTWTPYDAEDITRVTGTLDGAPFRGRVGST